MALGPPPHAPTPHLPPKNNNIKQTFEWDIEERLYLFLVVIHLSNQRTGLSSYQVSVKSMRGSGVSHLHVLITIPQTFNEYFSAEHGRLLSLWRAVVAFRRQFSEMKTATERDLSHVRADVTKAARSIHSSCLNLGANMRSVDTQGQVIVRPHRLLALYRFLSFCLPVSVFCRLSLFLPACQCLLSSLSLFAVFVLPCFAVCVPALSPPVSVSLLCVCVCLSLSFVCVRLSLSVSLSVSLSPLLSFLSHC